MAKRLEEIGPIERQGSHYYSWYVCHCGTKFRTRRDGISTGHTTSCGCKRPGHSKTAAYSSWRSMIQRCTNPNRWQYKYYGGKGIRVCKRWMSFENFLKDMGPRPEGTVLDRRKVTHHYTKRNCWWQPKQKAATNTTQNKILTYKGSSLCMAEWARQLNVKYGTLKSHIRKGGTLKSFMEIHG